MSTPLAVTDKNNTINCDSIRDRPYRIIDTQPLSTDILGYVDILIYPFQGHLALFQHSHKYADPATEIFIKMAICR